MKTLGLIGGMSWESTAIYYRQINETVKERLGGRHSAKLVLSSLEFHDLEALQRARDWEAAGEMLAQAARSLVLAGAEALVICANTMHLVAPAIMRAVDIPLLHIVDATADAISRAGFSAVGLLGTRFTMEEPFYRDRLRARRALETVIPPEADREILHRIVYDELCQGKVVDSSRAEFVRIIAELKAAGAEAVILGCTEFSLLINQAESALPLFDTAAIHARAAAEWALA